jgi:electron transport complex protein RnfG
MTPVLRGMLLSGVVLMGFTVVGTTLVALTYEGTAERIAANERAALLGRLAELAPAGGYDNELLQDTTTLQTPAFGSLSPQLVYRARRNGEPVAAFATIVALDGYSGPIRLLVGVRPDGKLTGVRVIAHKETPGLGDQIESERSDWILAFAGKGLGAPPPQQWAVRKDGGDFDQFTGATVTPRAVVGALTRFLAYFAQNRDAFFAPTAETAAPAKELSP